MIIEPADDPELVLQLGRSESPRTTGVLHQSDIISRLMERLDPKKYDRSRPMDLLRVEMGLLMENAVERELAIKFSTVRPGEIVGYMRNPDTGILVPVYMSPDGVNPALCAGEEYKATRKSCGKGLLDPDGAPWPKFLGWFCQMRGYAKWLECLDWILTVLYIDGDWKWTPDPENPKKKLPPHEQLRRYRIKFSEEEVEDNWTMLTNVAYQEGLLTCSN